MGIITTQEDNEFGNDCECWRPNKTPKHIWASFTGIKAGEKDAGNILPNRNVIVKLTQIAQCHYSGFGGIYDVHWKGNFEGDGLLSSFKGPGPGDYVFYGRTTLCSFYFVNDLVNPAWGVGGNGAISWVTPP